MHNHPGWRRKSLEHPEFEVAAYGEGLIDGIEIMNGGEFYPKAISRAHAKNLFVSANTDIHDSATETYRAQGHRRNMTLIFAKENTLEALREAIEARRTLAYSFGTIAGDEQLLKESVYPQPLLDRHDHRCAEQAAAPDRREHVVLRTGPSADRAGAVIRLSDGGKAGGEVLPRRPCSFRLLATLIYYSFFRISRHGSCRSGRIPFPIETKYPTPKKIENALFLSISIATNKFFIYFC